METSFYWRNKIRSSCPTGVILVREFQVSVRAFLVTSGVRNFWNEPFSSRYGRDDEELLGIRFCNEVVVASQQLSPAPPSPPHQTTEAGCSSQTQNNSSRRQRGSENDINAAQVSFRFFLIERIFGHSRRLLTPCHIAEIKFKRVLASQNAMHFFIVFSWNVGSTKFVEKYYPISLEKPNVTLWLSKYSYINLKWSGSLGFSLITFNKLDYLDLIWTLLQLYPSSKWIRFLKTVASNPNNLLKLLLSLSLEVPYVFGVFDFLALHAF